MISVRLSPPEARRALLEWEKILSAANIEGLPLKQLANLPDLLKAVTVTAQGHLSRWLSWEVARFSSFPSDLGIDRHFLHRLRVIEKKHFVLVSMRQLDSRFLRAHPRRPFDLLSLRLSLPQEQLQKELNEFLKEQTLCVGYHVDALNGDLINNPDSISSTDPSKAFSITPDIRRFPQIDKILQEFNKDVHDLIRNYERWLTEYDIKDYLGAIQKGLLTALPILLIASLFDGYGMPWLEAHALNMAEPFRKGLEILIRLVTGGIATVFIWLNLEGGLKEVLRFSGGKFKPVSNALIVYRAAAAALLLGPVAVLLAKYFGLPDTAPMYAGVAMLAASADNIAGAFTQLFVSFKSAGFRKRLSRINAAIRHPFFMASIGGVTTLTIASAITRAITGGGIFSLVSTMGLEGLFMGVGDTVIIYLLLRIAAGVKLRQLLQKARKHP